MTNDPSGQARFFGGHDQAKKLNNNPTGEMGRGPFNVETLESSDLEVDPSSPQHLLKTWNLERRQSLKNSGDDKLDLWQKIKDEL